MTPDLHYWPDLREWLHDLGWLAFLLTLAFWLVNRKTALAFQSSGHEITRVRESGNAPSTLKIHSADDPQQQTCKVCGQRDKFDFDVPDAVWAKVVPVDLRCRVVCLACFDEFAREAGVDYASQLHALHFAGDRASFIFRVASAVNVKGPCRYF